jgi:hypothetical protein
MSNNNFFTPTNYESPEQRNYSRRYTNRNWQRLYFNAPRELSNEQRLEYANRQFELLSSPESSNSRPLSLRR